MRSKTLLAVALLALLVIGCSKDDALNQIIEPTQSTLQEPMPKAEINAFINQSLEKNEVFRWEKASDFMLWSAIVQSDSIVAIGYQAPGTTNIKEKMHQINIQDDAWKQVKMEIIDLIVTETNNAFPNENYKAEDLLVFEEELILPVIDIKLFAPDLITKLRAMPEVRYVEPMGYIMEEIRDRSDSGCNVGPAGNLTSADYTTISPNVKVPWNFYNAGIPSAWSRSTGAGITISVIDTGTSPGQENLGSAFNSGYSQGRFIQRAGTYVSSWWWWANPDGPDDQCGHGTQMAGLATAPRGNDGNSVGVAYNSNLLAIRACQDVVILGSNESRGVSDALTIAGGRSDVKVISMSIGSVFWFNRIADAIYYAYGNGKMIIAAAGTSFEATSWYGVIFPAYMAETVAVTGIKEGSPMVKCNSCHSGSEVDFVAVMQRRNDNSRTSLTLAPSGNTPARVGGSSAATATTAGIAALIWATNPSQSRSQVLQRMKNASQFYPSRNAQFGWGTINAAAAVY